MDTSWRRLPSGRPATCGPLGLTLLALGIALVPVLQPLMSADLTCGYDNAFHLWRAVQIDQLWGDGILYSRWAPDMARGFGFPLYVFVSPFPPALVALLHRLGLVWSVALNAVFALGIVLGSLGTYGLAVELFRTDAGGGRMAGLVAAVAYAYAPFQAYDVFSRGSLWESFAWAFPPLVLLGLHRWSLYRERRYLALGTLAFAALLLSHHLFAFLFAPLFALWVLVHGWERRSWAVVGRGALVGVVGLGMTAFFWGPAVLERSLVQTGRLLGTWVFDYRYNFLSPAHLLALPRRADPALLNDWPEKALGLIPALVALTSFAGWRHLSVRRRRQVGVLWGVAIGAGLLALPVSRPIWDALPFLSYVQFPWRTLGPAAFCLALLAGAGARGPAAWWGRGDAGPGHGVVAAVLLVLLIAGGLGWLYPQHCAPPSDPSVAGMIRWERMTDTLGTTAKGEYLPIWVETFPDVALDDAYAAGGVIERLDIASLPEGARVSGATYGLQRAEIGLTTPSAFRARYLAFYYPGWRVTIDGTEVPVAPEDGSGLLTFDVPGGEHMIEVRFGEMPQRWAADAVSVLSALLLVGGIVAPWSRRMVAPWSRRRREEPYDRRSGAVDGGDRAGLLVLLTVAVLVLGKVALVERLGILWRATRLTPGGTLTGIGKPLEVNFGNRALLLGIDPLPASVRGDATPALTLYWRSLEPGPAEWHVGLTLVAPDGTRWLVGLRPARWARTPPPLHEWPTDAYARMDFDLELPPGLAPGRFAVEMSLFDRATAAPASVLGADGNPVAPTLALGDIELRAPSTVPSPASLGAAPTATLDTCGAVGLWAASLSRTTMAPGDLLEMTTVWEAGAQPAGEVVLTLTLDDAAGTRLRTWDDVPPVGWWPTRQWSPGERWVGRTSLRLPGSLPTGLVTLSLALDGCDLATWSLDVEAPSRLWAVPEGFTAVGARLGERARLVGVRGLREVVAPGETLQIELAWEALREMETAYRVFVHLVGEEGVVVAQDDGEPVGWTRPTTGWAVGEIVIDARTLVIPSGKAGARYELRVGLYGPDGVRLATATAEDAVGVGSVTSDE